LAAISKVDKRSLVTGLNESVHGAPQSTSTGLQVHAELDPGIYETKVKIGDEQMATIALDRHDFHGEWNYTLHPEPPA